MMSSAFALLHTLVFRYLRTRWTLNVLTVLSVALGVAVYLAVRTVNHSAGKAFEASVDFVAGKSHLEVVPSGGLLPETAYPVVREFAGVAAATPVVESYATVPGLPGRYLRLLGVDPFTNAPFATTSIQTGEGFDLEGWLGNPATLTVSQDWLDQTGLAPGATVELAVNGQTRTVTIGGVFRTEEGFEDGSESVALMDIGWAQELTDRTGELSSIQVLLDDPGDLEAVRDALQTVLPETVRVQAPESRSLQVQRMLDGFELNVQALSMVSVLVGVFLIYNAVSASVVRRRREIGILRSCGASRAQVFALFAGEAGVLGAIGVALGLACGPLLAGSLIGMVERTISTHYMLVSIDRIFVSPWAVVAALVYGLGATLLGASRPAWEAAQVDPVATFHPEHDVDRARGRPRAWRLIALGIISLLGAAGFAALALRSGPPWLSFVSALLVLSGFSLLIPAACRGLARVASVASAQSKSRWSSLFRLGSDNLGRTLHRSAVSAAALMTAIAVSIGVSVMVYSFRNTVGAWTNTAMRADLYLSPASNAVLGLKAYTPQEIKDFVEGYPGASRVETYLERQLPMPDGQEYALAIVDDTYADSLTFLGGNDDGKRQAYLQPGHVAVSETFAAEFDLEAGDTISLPALEGNKPFTIAGVFYDYADDRGAVYLARSNFDSVWNDPRFHSLAAFLEDPDRTAEVIAAIEEKFHGAGEFTILSNRALKTRVFKVFDETFSVTYILRTIAVVVAVIGITLALMTLVTERSREIAVLRAVGASPGQVFAVNLAEAGLIGLAAALVGLVCGLAMAMVLTWVVNKAFFGWTIQFEIPWGELVLVPFWVVAVSLIAGLLPARRAAGLPLAQSLRTE